MSLAVGRPSYRSARRETGGQGISRGRERVWVQRYNWLHFVRIGRKNGCVWEIDSGIPGNEVGGGWGAGVRWGSRKDRFCCKGKIHWVRPATPRYTRASRWLDGADGAVTAGSADVPGRRAWGCPPIREIARGGGRV